MLMPLLGSARDLDLERLMQFGTDLVLSGWLALALVLTACDTQRPLHSVPAVPSVSGAGSAAPAQPDGEDDDAGVGEREDGERCSRNSQCASEYCDNGFCCADGECCRDAEDCGEGSGIADICEDHSECQGVRGRFTCNENRCRVRDAKDDDRACDDAVEADGCGPYRSAFCTGDREQAAPACPTSCASDSECDRTARCVDERCVDSRRRNGASCERRGDCTSDVCEDGRCCRAAGDCDATEEVTQADEMSCLGIFTGNIATDACRQCACAECAPSMLDCYDSGDTTRDGLCGAVPTCVYYASCMGDCSDDVLGCYGERCYCGAGNSACLDAYGPCARQIEAAGGSSDPATLLEHLHDPSYALYYAHSYSQCLADRCSEPCSRFGAP
jgi:hypothetical protein